MTYGLGERLIESRKMLRDLFNEAMKVYELNEDRYSDTWRDSTIEFLNKRLNGEFFELDTAYGIDYYKELLDVIVVAAMLAKRFDEEGMK